MKVTLYIAMSVNGMIARPEGDEDFLSHENWEAFCNLAKEYGNFIIGRKTYDEVAKWGEGYSFDDLVGIRKVILSQNPAFKPEGYLIAFSPQDAVDKLSSEGFEKMLVAGGATINSAFAKAGLLDEIQINIEPVFIGKGRPLFSPDDFDLRAEVMSVSQSAEGIVTLKYKVEKQS